MPATKLRITKGQRFGRLTALKNHGLRRGYFVWYCRCDCGNYVHVRSSHLRASTRSCGCIGREKTSARSRTHGQTGTPEYHAWRMAIYRCHRPKHKAFDAYGGRGIRVCPEWLHDFAAFLRHVGPRPTPKHSLDRIHNDGDYAPGNVRWATKREQRRNSRSLHLVTYQGETKSLIEWTEQLGLRWSTTQRRLKRGWTPHRAFTEPVH